MQNYTCRKLVLWVLPQRTPPSLVRLLKLIACHHECEYSPPRYSYNSSENEKNNRQTTTEKALLCPQQPLVCSPWVPFEPLTWRKMEVHWRESNHKKTIHSECGNPSRDVAGSNVKFQLPCPGFKHNTNQKVTSFNWFQPP